MVTLELTELKDIPIPYDFYAFTQRMLKELNITKGSIEITFVDNKTLKKMNIKHLSHNYNTDIITFNLGSLEEPVGDIYISIDQAQKNAKIEGHDLKKELQTLIIHGLLHVLGMTDETEPERAKMFAKQEALLELEERKPYNQGKTI